MKHVKVFLQLLDLSNIVRGKVQVHVLGKNRRIGDEVDANIHNFKELYCVNAVEQRYIFHGVSTEMATKNVLNHDGVHLNQRGFFNLKSLIKAKIISRYWKFCCWMIHIVFVVNCFYLDLFAFGFYHDTLSWNVINVWFY